MARNTSSREENIMYVFDRVQSRTSKEIQILREYGFEIRRQADTAAHRTGERPFGGAFAEEQMRRARPKRNPENTVRTDGGGYIYRPQKMTGNGGVRVAAAEKVPHFRLVLEKIVNLIDSVEERAKNDENVAKRRAILEKRWSENKNNVKLALLLAVVTAVLSFGIYKLFFVVKTVDAGGSQFYSANEIIGASGIQYGENLYSFSAKEAEDSITFHCPYIREAEVRRTIPKTVGIYTEDDTAVYSASIWGDTVELSASLKVLGKTTTEEASAKGLVSLVIPEVKYSVAGRIVEFRDEKSERFVRDTLRTVTESNAADKITYIDLSDEYNILMEADGRYSLKIGGENDLGLKLRMLYKTLTEGEFDKSLPATIDLTTVGEACVRYDF